MWAAEVTEPAPKATELAWFDNDPKPSATASAANARACGPIAIVLFEVACVFAPIAMLLVTTRFAVGVPLLAFVPIAILLPPSMLLPAPTIMAKLLSPFTLLPALVLNAKFWLPSTYWPVVGPIATFLMPETAFWPAFEPMDTPSVLPVAELFPEPAWRPIKTAP